LVRTKEYVNLSGDRDTKNHNIIFYLLLCVHQIKEATEKTGGMGLGWECYRVCVIVELASSENSSLFMNSLVEWKNEGKNQTKNLV
jgi:hypothetical protein